MYKISHRGGGSVSSLWSIPESNGIFRHVAPDKSKFPQNIKQVHVSKVSYFLHLPEIVTINRITMKPGLNGHSKIDKT